MIIEFFGHSCAGKTTLVKALQARRTGLPFPCHFDIDAKREILYQHYHRRGMAGTFLAMLLKRSDTFLKFLASERIYPETLLFKEPDDPLARFTEFFSHRKRKEDFPSEPMQDFYVLRSISLRHAMESRNIKGTYLLDESLLHRTLTNALHERDPTCFVRGCLNIMPLPAAAVCVHETPEIILSRIHKRRGHLVDLYNTEGVPELAINLSLDIRDRLVEKGIPVCAIQPTQHSNPEEVVAEFLAQHIQARSGN